MKIKNIEISGYAALAPMAGVADRAMRELCRDFGAAYTVSELISAKGITLGDRKSAALLECSEGERPVATQLFGNDPKIMADAAKKALEYNPDFIDINMGCPAPKVAGNGGGSALMKDIRLAEQIAKSVVDVSTVPVTAKIRTGWDSNSVCAKELAQRLEAAGISAITVHGRTREQMYAPPVDIKSIADVKRAVKIPVIANGDVTDGASAKQMYEQTGCDFIMVGRAAMGNPWVFRAINEYMEKGILLNEPSIEEKIFVLRKQVKRMSEIKDEKITYLEARKHTAWYLKGFKGAAKLRVLCSNISCYEDFDNLCKTALEYQK